MRLYEVRWREDARTNTISSSWRFARGGEGGSTQESAGLKAKVRSPHSGHDRPWRGSGITPEWV